MTTTFLVRFCNHSHYIASNRRMADQDDLYDINQVLTGNTSAFEALVRRHQHHVFNMVYRIIQDREESEEVAQDIFVKVYHSLSGYKKASTFSTWLYRITYNAAISHHRKKKIITFPIQEELPEETSNIEFFNDFEDVTALRQQYLPQALEQLNGELQLLISMYYQQDMSITEISEITDISKSNVKIKLYRARKCLYDYISTMLEPANQSVL